MNEYSKRDLYIWIMLVLLTLPHLNLPYLNQFDFTDTFINVGRVISVLLITGYMLIVVKRISIIAVLIGIQQGYVLCNTIVMGGIARDTAISAFSVMSVVLLYDLAQENKKIFLSSQLFCFELVIYINLLTEILFPDSLYVDFPDGADVIVKNWLLGYYNNHTKFFIPALMIAFLYKHETGKKVRTYILTMAIFISAFMAWSGGVLLTLFGMAAAYLLFKNWTKIFNYYTYWLIHILFFVFIILLKMQNLFRWLIEGILGKWNSLMGRITLWDRYLGFISERFVFGYGVEDSMLRRIKGGYKWASYAHNLLLELMYQGGIINLLLFTIIVIVAGRNIYKYRDTAESKIIAIAFLGWCLQNLVEAFMSPFLMGMFVIAYYGNKENGAIMPEWTFSYWKNSLLNLFCKNQINENH